DRFPRPTIPHHHRAAAVLSFRDDSLEAAIRDRVVFDVHRQPLDRRIETRPLRHGPALKYAVELEAKVVMEMTGGVFLNDERESAARRLRAGRLGRLVEMSLAVVVSEAHDNSSALSERQAIEEMMRSSSVTWRRVCGNNSLRMSERHSGASVVSLRAAS